MERVILEKAEAQVQKWKSEWPERVRQRSGESSRELTGGGEGVVEGVQRDLEKECFQVEEKVPAGGK